MSETKIKRLEEEIGTYLDRLQAAHEEIAVLREALQVAEGTIRRALECFARTEDSKGRDALMRYRFAHVHEAAGMER